MATYIPNATQTTEPVESRTVESAALEFRTLKTSINARIEDVQDGLDTEIVNRIAGDVNLQTQNNAQDVRLVAIENALLSIGEGGLPGTVYVQRFSGTGAQTAFTLTATPQSGNVVDIYINGIYQNKDTFSVAGAVITFSEAPPAGTDNIEVQVTVTIALGETDASLVSFQQAGTGTAVRTAQDKLREWVSVKDFGAVGDGVTNDSAAVQAAVTHCLNTGDQLYWPDGTYLTASSISEFHSVKHFGAGVVKRGLDMFYISPSSSTTNRIYVATSGDANNDGLSSSQPITTLQSAINKLPKYGPVLKGTWAIELAAGTYARGRFPDEGLYSEKPIEVNGPDVGGHPNVPTAIVSEGANGISAEAIRIRQGARVKCSNIHFIGFNGTTSSGGFTSGGFCEIYSVNCHYTNCTWGISGIQHSVVEVKGGVFDGCGFDPSANPYSSGGGIRGLFLTKFSVGVQNAGTLINGPIFKNNNFGVFAQEHIDGHVDFCTFEDNIHHVRMNVCSRLNLGGSSFKRASGSAVWAQDNSVVALFSNNVFGTGADANFVNVICNSGATIAAASTSLFLTPSPFSTSERCIARAIPNQNINTTSATIFHTNSLIANIWIDGQTAISGMKKLRFKVYGNLTGTAGFKRIQQRFGSASPAIITFTDTETGKFEIEGHVQIGTNPIGSQYLFIRGVRHLGTTARLAQITATEAMTSDTTFNLEAVVENSADTITVEAYEVWVDGL